MVAVKGISGLLAEHAFTQGLDDDALAVLAGCARNVRFRADQYIFREGGRADWFYLLRRGIVALEMPVPGRGRTLIQTIRAGDILGVSWLFPPYRWHFDARAVTDTGAIAFDAACLRGTCNADPALGYALMLRFAPKLSARLQATRLQLADLYGDPDAVETG
jgi:CRP-like cAMP-binding protein